MWMIGAGCALAGAWMAKYHRLAALALIGGTGIVTAATFLWLSAPDLALTQLMVETVTTVLILLGLGAGRRRGSSRLPARRSRPGARGFVIRVISRLRSVAEPPLAALTYAVLVHPARTPLPTSFCSMRLAAVVGRTWSTCCWSTSAASTRWARSPCLAVVALTVYALLRRFRPAAESASIPPQQRFQGDPASQRSPAEQANSGYLLVPHLPASAAAFRGDRSLFLHARSITCRVAASWPD